MIPPPGGPGKAAPLPSRRDRSWGGICPGPLGSSGIQDHDAIRVGGLGDWLAGLPEQRDVLSHRLDHQLLGRAVRGPGRDHPGQVGRVGRIADFVVAFENDYVASYGRSLRKPACFRMLDSGFGFKVALGLPATVTSPGLTGWE